MIGKIRLEYIIFCPIEASDEIIEAVALDLEETIYQEEKLKELGINVDDITNELF